MSAIALKRNKRMLFLSIEFENVKIYALVDSGGYIKAISERDAAKIKRGAKYRIISIAPPPPFKVPYANAELELPLASYTMRLELTITPSKNYSPKRTRHS